MRFIGNESGLTTNGGTVERESSGSYEFENISVNLGDFKSTGKYSALYADSKYWNNNKLNLDNHLKIFGAERQVTINGTTIPVSSGSFAIDSSDTLNLTDNAVLHFGDGIAFTCEGSLVHGSGTTFGLDGYALSLSLLPLSRSFAEGGMFEKLYGAPVNGTLTIDNTLSLGGDTNFIVLAGERVDLSNGHLKLVDSAYLGLHGTGSSISDYTKVTLDPNTTVELADAGILTIASFSTGGTFYGLFPYANDNTLPISNTLCLSGTSALTVDSGKTLQFSGDTSKCRSAKAITKGSGSTINFLNTTVNSSDFSSIFGGALNRFPGVYKYDAQTNKITIDNNFWLGEWQLIFGASGSTLIVKDGDTIYISSSSSKPGKLLVGAESTLRFEGGAKIAGIDSSRTTRISIDGGSTTEFAGVDCDVSDFATNGDYANLYAYDYTKKIVTINNSANFTEASSFKVNSGYGVTASGALKLDALSTLTIDGAKNNVSFTVADYQKVTRSPLSSVELINFANGNLGVGSFESDGALKNLYPVENKVLSVDNKLCLCGKISRKNTYSYPSTFSVESGKKLSLGPNGRLGMDVAGSTLIFQTGNNGFSAEDYSQLQVAPGAIYKFNGDPALTDSDFVTDGKYANIFSSNYGGGGMAPGYSSVTIGNQVNFQSTGLIVSSRNLIIDDVAVTFDENSSFTLNADYTLQLNGNDAKFTLTPGKAMLAKNSTVGFNGCGDLNLNSFTSSSSKYKGLFDVNSTNKTFTTGANINLSSVLMSGSNYAETTLTVAAGETFSMHSLYADEHCKVTVKGTGDTTGELHTTSGVAGNVTFSGVIFSTNDFGTGQNSKFPNLLAAPDKSSGDKACTLILDSGTIFTDKDQNYKNSTHMLSGATFIIDKALATPGQANPTKYSEFVTRDAGSIFELSGTSSTKSLKISTLSLCTGADDNYSGGGIVTNDNIGILYSSSANKCDVNNSLRLNNVDLRIGGSANGITACGLQLAGDSTTGVVGELILAGYSQLLFDANSVIRGYKQNTDHRLPGLILEKDSSTTFQFYGMNFGFALFGAVATTATNPGNLQYIYGVNQDNASGSYNVTIDNCMQLSGGSTFTVGSNEQVTFSGPNARIKLPDVPSSDNSSVSWTENFWEYNSGGVTGSYITFTSCGTVTMPEIIAKNNEGWTTQNRFNIVAPKEIANVTSGSNLSHKSYSGGNAPVLSMKYSFGQDSVLSLEYQSSYQGDISHPLNTVYLCRFSDFKSTTGLEDSFKAWLSDIEFTNNATLKIVNANVSLGFPCVYDRVFTNKAYFYKCTRANSSTFEFYNVGTFTIDEFNCDTTEAEKITNKTSDLASHCKTTLKYGGLYYSVSNTTQTQTVVQNPYQSSESTVAGNNAWMLRVDNILKLSGNSTLNITSKSGSPSGMLDLTGNNNFPNKGTIVIAGTDANSNGESCLLVSGTGVLEIGAPADINDANATQAELWIGNNVEKVDNAGNVIINPSYNAVLEFDYGSKFVGPSTYSANTSEGNIFKMPGSTCRFYPAASGTPTPLGIDSFLNPTNGHPSYIGIYNAYSTTDGDVTTKTIEIDNKLSLKGGLQFTLNANDVMTFVGNYSGVKSFDISGNTRTPVVYDAVSSLGSISFNGVGDLTSADFDADCRFADLLYDRLYHCWQVSFASLTLQDGPDQYLNKGAQTFKLADASVSTILVKSGETLPLNSCKSVNLVGDSRIYGVTGAKITIDTTTAINISTNGSADITMFAPGEWKQGSATNQGKYAGLYGGNLTCSDPTYALNVINDLSIQLTEGEFNVLNSQTIDVQKSLTIDSSNYNIQTGGIVTVEPGATFVVKNTQLNVNGTLNLNGDLCFNGDLYFNGQLTDSSGKVIPCVDISNGTVSFGADSFISFGDNINIKPANFLNSDVCPGLFTAVENSDFAIKLIQQEQPLYKSYKLQLNKAMHIRDGGTLTLMMGDMLELEDGGGFIAEDGTHVVADKLSTIKVTSSANHLQFPTYVDEKTGFTKSQYSVLEFSFDNCTLTPKEVGPLYYYHKVQDRDQQSYWEKVLFSPPPAYPNVYAYSDATIQANKTYVIDNCLKFSGTNSSFTIDVPTKVTGSLAFGTGSSLIINSANNTSNLSFDSAVVLPSNFAIGSTCTINGFNFDTRDLLTPGKLQGLYPFSNNEIDVGNNLTLSGSSSGSVPAHFVVGAGHILNFINLDQHPIPTGVKQTTIQVPDGPYPIFNIVNDNPDTKSEAIVKFSLSGDYNWPDKFIFGFDKTVNSNSSLGLIDMIDLGTNSALSLENDSKVSPYLQLNITCPLAGVNIGSSVCAPIVLGLGDNWTLGVKADGSSDTLTFAQANIGYASLSPDTITCSDSYISIGQNATLAVASEGYLINSGANIGIADSCADLFRASSSVTASSWTVNIGAKSTLRVSDRSVGDSSSANIGIADSCGLASASSVIANNWTVNIGDGSAFIGTAFGGDVSSSANIGIATSCDVVAASSVIANNWTVNIGDGSILIGAAFGGDKNSSANIGIAISNTGSATAPSVTTNNWTVNIGDGSTLSGAAVGVGVCVNGKAVPADSSTWAINDWNVTTNGSCNIISVGENSRCFGCGNSTNWTVKFLSGADDKDSVVNLVSMNGTLSQGADDSIKITTSGLVKDCLGDVFSFDDSSRVIIGDSESADAKIVKVNILGNGSLLSGVIHSNGRVNVFGGTLRLGDGIQLYPSCSVNLLGLDKLSQEGLSASFEDSSVTLSRLGLPALTGADAGTGQLCVGDELYFGATCSGKNSAGQVVLDGNSISHISVDQGANITLPKNLSFRFFDATEQTAADINNIYIGEEGISILSIPEGSNIGDIVNIAGVPLSEGYSTSALSGEYFTWEGLNLCAKSNGLFLSTSANGAVRQPNEKALKISKVGHIINMNKVSVETMLSSIDDRLNDLRKFPGIYARVVGGTGHARFGSGNSDYNSIGFVAGCDYEVVLASRYLRYGVALSGIKFNSDIAAITDSKLDVRTLQVAVYCAYESYDNSGKKFDANLTVGYANINDNMKRSVSAYDIETKYKNDVIFGRAALMQSFYAKNNWQIGPKVSLTVYRLSQGAVDEKVVAGHDAFSLSNMTVNIVDGVLSLSAKKDVQYDTIRQNSITFYSDFGAKFRARTGISNVKCSIDSLNPFKPYIDSFDKVGFVGSVGTNISLYNNWNIFGQCNASITKNTTDYSFCAGIGYDF